ncbi:MAG: LacI family DNA-binding transcriptional regulator [Eubacteriales bacterium]|nr:LacI family DNA-binding transcriptional regulator [Eubacteriales bacterium]
MAATMKDVARRAGVSIYTISKYINGGTLKEKNRIAVENAIRELGYRPNTIAQSLRTSYSRTIGVLVPTFHSAYNLAAITAIEETLEKFGYGALISDCGGDPAAEEGKLDFLLRKTVDGIILIPAGRTAPHIAKAVRRNVPVVLLDRLPEGLECDAVLSDNRDAVKAAVQSLIALGHKNIALIAGPEDAFTARERLYGYMEALRGAGVPLVKDFVRHTNGTMEEGFRAMMDLWLLPERPSAVVAAENELTTGVFLAVTKRRIFVPDELSVVGFDTQAVSELVRPTLHSVVQPVEKLAQTAAKLVLRRVGGDLNGYPRVSITPSEWKIGESVGRCLVVPAATRMSGTGRFPRV